MKEMSSKIRLNKFIAEATGVSRREADVMISAGKVTVIRGRMDSPTKSADDTKKTAPCDDIAKLGRQITSGDQVFIDGKLIKSRAEHVTLILNKPIGVLSSRRAQGGNRTIYDLLPPKYKHLKTAGRLDKDSSGLMILSSDGDLIQQLTHPRYEKTKVYEVQLSKSLSPLHQQMISDIGIDLPDGKSRLRLDRIQNIDSKFLQRLWCVTMHEGRNRQIRRTFAALGYDVVKLHRVSLGKYMLGNLKPRDFRLVK